MRRSARGGNLSRRRADHPTYRVGPLGADHRPVPHPDRVPEATHTPQPPMPDLFRDSVLDAPSREAFAPGAVLLRRLALPWVDEILAALGDIGAQAPFRYMATPGGSSCPSR